ncbi:MAG TPA: TolC family protein, partial [Gemmatimonadales bacterium]
MHDVRRALIRVALSALFGTTGAMAQGTGSVERERLTLADVFRSLESRSPQLEAARQMATAAEARIKPASTLADPQFQFGLMNRNLPGLGLQDPLGMTQVQVMQMVPVAGQLGLAGRAAAARAAGAHARAEDVRWELRARAAMAFYEIYQLDHTIEVSTETQTLLRDLASTSRTMYSVGQG